MKRTVLVALCGLAACSEPPVAESTGVDSNEEAKLWVSDQFADRHTCASRECGVVGRLFFREGVTAVEEKNGWVRVSEYYDANCQNGRSGYVDKGAAECAQGNGIIDGQMAEWVDRSLLSEDRPADPADTANIEESMIAQSDDFNLHRNAFLAAANELISEGTCTPEDFVEMGGWVKSSNHRDQPVYFTYCGGMTTANRIYVDVSDGRVFR